jgi:hypothetical protein
MGDQGGVKAKLLQRIPDIFVLGCVCHSMALCASKSAEKLPIGWKNLPVMCIITLVIVHTDCYICRRYRRYWS